MGKRLTEKRYLKTFIKQFIASSAKSLTERGASAEEYQAYFNGASNLFRILIDEECLKCSKTFEELYEDLATPKPKKRRYKKSEND